jgi:4-hydroxy-tetrahydrodipicolinate synthase
MAELFRTSRNIKGVKDATANMARTTRTRVACGPDFVQLSGEDITALGFNAHGGTGCISVTANVAPGLCSQFQQATLSGDYATALSIQDRLAPLHDALFIEPNPTGAKYALSLLGKMENELRLPLVEVADTTKAAIREAMTHAGLLN